MIIVIFLLIIQISPLYCIQNNSPYFERDFLTNYDCVAQSLKKDGFKDVYITTSDNLMLHGLLLERKQATCTIIIFPGFLPGRKESLAPFFEILSNNYNILFVDARGHGGSQGPLLLTAWNYGINEYKDIIGACQFINTNYDTPIIILGICAGAFNAMHALNHLGTHAQCLDIKGLIFDSGWTSVTQTSLSAPIGRANDLLAAFLGCKKHKYQSYLYKTTSLISTVSLTVLHSIFFRIPFWCNEHMTSLYNASQNVKIPILFIHSYDDTYIPIKDVQLFASQVQKSSHWWITKPSKHACHHLKHTTEYAQKINIFIDQLLS